MFSRVTHLILYRTFIVERLLMALGWTSFVSLWGCLLSWWSCATHQRWWQGYPGAYRDQPGWHPWFTCCRGSPYHQRCTVGFFFELQNIWKKEQVTIRDHACRVYNTTSFCISSVLCFFFFYFPRSAGRWYDQSCCCGCSRNGRPCVAGAGGITVDYAAAKLTVGSVTVTEGHILTIDGSTGEVMVGEVPTVLWQQTYWTDLGPHLVYTGRRHNNQIEPD